MVQSSGSQSRLYRPLGAVGLRKETLRDKEAAGGAGGGPPRARCSLYDWSDFRPDIGKLVSLHKAPFIAVRIY
jgi:hypothetical protein